MVDSNKRKVTYDLKLEILEALDSGLSIRKTADRFHVSPGCVQGVKKKRVELTDAYCNLYGAAQQRQSPNSAVNILLYRWFRLARSNGYIITGPILQLEALKIHKALQVTTEFKASEGWLEKWKKRHSISMYAISGESAVIDREVVSNWKANLPALCAKYNAANIFNMDKTAFFYRALPARLLVEKGETCKGGKLAKERITVALTCSIAGEKLKPLVIGKSKQPRAFKSTNLCAIACEYVNTNKAWMTTDLYNMWMLTLNNNMVRQNRNILLFVDNAPVHVLDYSTEQLLTNVQVEFLPKNTTAETQPLDGGVIWAFKAVMRKNLLLKLLSMMDLNTDNTHASKIAKKLTVLDAMLSVAAAWASVSNITIQKCSKRCGFELTRNNNNQTEEVSQQLVSQNEFEALLQQVQAHNPNPDNRQYLQQIFECDNLACYEEEEDLVVSIVNSYNMSNETQEQELTNAVNDDDVDDSNVVKVTDQEMKAALQTAARYYKQNGMAKKAMKTYQDLRTLHANQTSQLQQSSLKQYFKPK